MRKLGASLAMQEEHVIRGFRVAISVLILACAFVSLTGAGIAIEQISAPSPSVAGKPAGIPNRDAGARGQPGVANKGGGGTSPGERQRSDCGAQAGAAAGNNGTGCPPARAAKEGDTPGGNVEPAPRRRASPCVGSRDRQCL